MSLLKKKAHKRASSRPLQERIRVRSRTDGHVRFQIPPELCGPAAAAVLTERLAEAEGIYRVAVYRRAGKLSVRYLDTVCGFREVVLALVAVLDHIAAHPPEEDGRAPETLRDRLMAPVRTLKDKTDAWRGKARIAAAVVAARSGLPFKLPADLEGTTINFLNDLVAFYLIKAHWELITQQWLKNPIRYRYAWLTVFYLVFLMVRYRKAGQKKFAGKDKKDKKAAA